MIDRDNMLRVIKKGMKVFDNRGDEIGTVEFVRSSEAVGFKGPVAAAPPDEPIEPDLVDVIRKMFSSDRLPKEMHERLLMHGFIKVDRAKLFGADRYVMPDQIEKVDKHGVHLKVADSEGVLKA
ncbi:MAG: hypothetical protein R6V46_17930 [Desulfatiglandaceae bacterium]